MLKKKILNVKAEEIGERTVRFKISSEVVDRDGDILIAEGCDFSNYEKNPVFLPFHEYNEFPLGKVVNYFVEDKAIYADVYFPTVEELSTDEKSVSEKAKLVDFTYHCYKTGMLNAVSVGFLIQDYEENKETGGYIVKKWELLEFSAVSVPANQEAVTQAVKSFGEDFVKKIGMEVKSGRRISKETQKTLDDIKECARHLLELVEGLETEEEKPEEPKQENKPCEEPNKSEDGNSDDEIEIEEDEKPEDDEIEIEE